LHDRELAVVLVRLADARADGDTIDAVVRGVGMNNVGSSKEGYTAPSVTGRADAVAAALRMANFAPERRSTGVRDNKSTPSVKTAIVRAASKSMRFSAKTNVFSIHDVKLALQIYFVPL